MQFVWTDLDMPGKATVLRWLTACPEFRDQSEHAREARADAIFEEILDIADDSAGDFVETADGRKPDWENIQGSRLRIDAREWMLARMLPTKYGDRATLDAAEDSRLEIVVTHACHRRSGEFQDGFTTLNGFGGQRE